jgi:hypothetical protein
LPASCPTFAAEVHATEISYRRHRFPPMIILQHAWYCYTTRAIEPAGKLGFTGLSHRQLGIE